MLLKSIITISTPYAIYHLKEKDNQDNCLKRYSFGNTTFL